MKRTIATVLAAALAGLVLHTGTAAEPQKPAADTTTEHSAVPKPRANARPRPLSGRIAEVDQVHKTITVGKTIVYITSETRITKDGKPAVLADAKPGDEVGISYVPAEDGRYIARSVRIGPKADSTPKPAGQKPGQKPGAPQSTGQH